MINREKPFSKEGYELMGAAFEVHNLLGGGLLEEVYQESLEIELQLRGIAFDSKCSLVLRYKDRRLRKTYIPDLFVAGCLIVELKSATALASEHKAQLVNYMRITRSAVGYLINFGPIGKLEYQRFVLSDYLSNR